MKYQSLALLSILSISATMMACQKTRTERALYDNGKPMYEISYKGSLKHGTTVYYFEDGRKEVEFPYRDGVLEGRVTRWYFNGQKEYEDEYRNNLQDGRSLHYYVSGGISEENHFREGVLHGPYKAFWENGSQKISGRYADGLFDGHWDYFNESGIKVGEATFTKGTGTMKGYHPNGAISREVSYLGNLKHGTEIVYDEQGNITEENQFDAGEFISGMKRK